MDRLSQKALEEIRASREALLGIKKESLCGKSIVQWFKQWESAFSRAETILSGSLLAINVWRHMKGYEHETDLEILNEIRLKMVDTLDWAIRAIDNTQPTVKPILDELILKVSDTKLSTLLKEFNAAKDSTPNLASLGFRAIVALIIQERAKRAKPGSRLATKTDLVLEPDIGEALKEKIFDSAEAKLLNRFLSSGKKDIFDNVAHKPGMNTLVIKDDLAEAVELLNRLLPTIL